jgi:hypothetical protein
MGQKRRRPQKSQFMTWGGWYFRYLPLLILLMLMAKQSFEVLATNGDTFLGGEDFDMLLIDYLCR